MRFFCLTFFLVVVFQGKAQTILTWDDLAGGIFWESHTPNAMVTEFEKATFSPRLRDLEGKKVIITGYLLVLDGKQSVFLLSRNPMASCFFCGNGGPESVLELRFTKEHSFEMDTLLSVEGILRLNGSNPNSMYYRIENADALSFK